MSNRQLSAAAPGTIRSRPRHGSPGLVPENQSVQVAEAENHQRQMRRMSVSGTVSCTSFGGLAVMSITASEARKGLFPLIKKVNEDHDAIEIVSRHGNAVLVSAEDYAALREGAYLLRSPANARRLLKAYENALNGVHVTERPLTDPDAADAG
jgi:antitoxin YefM